jgi:hypothetical protein
MYGDNAALVLFLKADIDPEGASGWGWGAASLLLLRREEKPAFRLWLGLAESRRSAPDAQHDKADDASRQNLGGYGHTSGIKSPSTFADLRATIPTFRR